MTMTVTTMTTAPPGRDELVRARDRANTLVLQAEEAEREAKRARRRARSAQQRYATLLRRYHGEQTLPLTFEQQS